MEYNNSHPNVSCWTTQPFGLITQNQSNDYWEFHCKRLIPKDQIIIYNNDLSKTFGELILLLTGYNKDPINKLPMNKRFEYYKKYNQLYLCTFEEFIELTKLAYSIREYPIFEDPESNYNNIYPFNFSLIEEF